jgi:hypothetical protein
MVLSGICPAYLQYQRLLHASSTSAFLQRIGLPVAVVAPSQQLPLHPDHCYSELYFLGLEARVLREVLVLLEQPERQQEVMARALLNPLPLLLVLIDRL